MLETRRQCAKTLLAGPTSAVESVGSSLAMHTAWSILSLVLHDVPCQESAVFPQSRRRG